MTLRAAHTFLGVEFDWIAQDARGNVGFFSTAGEGPVPDAALTSAAVIDDLLSAVLELPVTGDARIDAPIDEHLDDWIEVARRGVYAFDWQHETQRYQRVATPTAPMSMRQLSGPLQTLASNVRLHLDLSSGPDFDATVGVTWLLDSL